MRATKLKSKLALAACILLAFTYGCGGSGSKDTSIASLPSTGSSSGTVTLSWTPPTQNMDGSYLTDLAGYNIYYGLKQGEYSNRINISNPGIATYVVTNLAPNTYYFVATSFNASGVESPYSSEVTRVVY
jgi:hypothetical protein